MTLATTAASVGLNVLNKVLEDSQTCNKLANLAQKAGQLIGGKGFANAIEKGFEKLQDKTETKPTKPQAEFSSVNIQTAQVFLNYFDVNQDGQVSKAELTDGVQKLESSGLANQGVFSQIHQTGKALLGQYDGIAKLDGQAAQISGLDIQHLAALDQDSQRLSAADITSLAQSLQTIS